MIICIDFDGVIVPEGYYPDIPDILMPNAKETLIALHNAGHHLILWTYRETNGCNLLEVTQFLITNDLGFFHLPGSFFDKKYWPKLPFDMIIDDKIPGGFQGWEFIRKAILG